MHSLTVSLLIASLFFHQIQNLAEANESLIKEQCHNAEVPAICEKYVESDPRSKTADSIGIARIIVDTLGDLAGTLAWKITTLASRIRGNNNTKQMTLEHCAKAYASAKSTDLAKAKEELKKGNYDEAESSISEAIYQCETSCKAAFLTFREEFPVDITFDIHVYEDLTDAAQRIIERF